MDKKTTQAAKCHNRKNEMLEYLRKAAERAKLAREHKVFVHDTDGNHGPVKQASK